jgi:beta-lactamase regulating signal transducer with metallopeptidase domain
MMVALLLDHLWQSSLFAGAAGLVTLALRGNSAATRFAVWFAACMKFLVPFAALTMLGHFILAPIAPLLQAPRLAQIAPMAAPFSGADPILVVPTAAVTSAATHGDWTILLLALWGTGVVILGLRWLVSWLKLKRLLREAADLEITAPIAVKSSPSRIEPGLVGIFRPAILLPHGIERELSPAEMNAVLAHELCHWRRHDTLSAAIQRGVEALFWFHPLVWWLGRRLVIERENACDEAVLAAGSNPQTYIESILKVCKFSLHSPLAYVPGIAGADLRMRLENILENRDTLLLSGAQKGLLGACAAIALAAPLFWGLLTTPSGMAAPQQTAGIPHPGTEAVLRRQLEGWQMRQPDIADMGTALAAATNGQRARLQREFDRLGTLKSITFKGNDGDSDVFLVRFEKGVFAWSVWPLQNGKVINQTHAPAVLREDGGPSPGLEAAIRRELDGDFAGKPAWEIMAPALRLATQRQWPAIAANAAKLGAVQSVTFQQVNLRGWDVYRVAFANGTQTVQAAPLTDGRLNGLVHGDFLLPRAAQRAGTDAWIRHFIAAQVKEAPDYNAMKPELARAMAMQWPDQKSYFQALGPLQSLIFEGGGRNGTDVYLATFRNGKLQWHIEAPDAEGKVGVLAFQKLDASGR